MSDPAVAAGWKIAHGWMASHSEKDCYDEIENYVDGYDKVLTRRCMRFACGLPIDAKSSAVNLGAPLDPIDGELCALRRQSDALACYCLDNDMEYMTEAQCRLAMCLPGSNALKRKEAFQNLVRHGLWKASVKPSGNSGQTYFPMIKTAHGLSSVVPQTALQGMLSLNDGPLNEEIDVHALREQFVSVHRVHNHNVLLRHLEIIKTQNALGAGKWPKENRTAYENADADVKKLKRRETHVRNVLDHCGDCRGVPIGTKFPSKTGYTTKYDRMSRMRGEAGGIQGMAKTMQLDANPELHEFDQDLRP